MGSMVRFSFLHKNTRKTYNTHVMMGTSLYITCFICDRESEIKKIPDRKIKLRTIPDHEN